MAGARLTKAEEIERMVAAAVDAGEERHLETVDFNDPNRPKTCLEVDFPILPINQIAQIEGNAGKPIYQMSKWWARRRSSVFRSTLIAAAAKAPEDQAEAAKLVWENYYCNHQKNPSFKNLKVADIFMGGGTTLVEGARLGMQMYGNDLNPVAWLVVKNELADVDIEEVKRLFAYIESEMKPQIMPFYACEGPGGEKGIWYSVETGKPMPEDFDPLAVAPEERKKYRYEGPEIIYTFWAKHGPCSAPGCNHRTPLFSSPVIAIKELSVKSWPKQKCEACKELFDIEAGEVRMAPDEPLIITEDEKPFTTLKSNGSFDCPHCGKNQYSTVINGKGKNKKVSLSLLIHPDWMKGAPGSDDQGDLGGTVTSTIEETKRWNELRQSTLKLIEVRGKLPEEITLPDSGEVMSTKNGTIPKRSTFTCQEETCGREQDVLDAVKASQTNGPFAEYALQCFSSRRSDTPAAYNGRYFKKISVKDTAQYNAALQEWQQRQDADLKGYWPQSEVPFGFMTGMANGDIRNGHGFTHWHTMFNPRQLLAHSLLLRTIDTAVGFSDIAKEIAVGVFQQYLRNQNMFCFWNSNADKMEPMFSNNNYHPKSTLIENAVFSDLGRGNLASCLTNTLKGIEWKQSVWETTSNEMLSNYDSFVNSSGKSILSGKGTKVSTMDNVLPGTSVTCGSSTELTHIESGSYDLVITDPPFGGLLHYSELADFFYVWLRLVLKDKYPEYFSGEYTPKTLEAVANKARNPEDADDFYKRVLTDCWREAHRILKPGGILSFTFHHSEDEPWVDVLESLFNSGFFLEATYPIRSDETKGKGEFGSKTIEYDIIHVCRKRTEEPSEISWPKLRRQILRDVRQLQNLLEHHQQAGLPEADIEVIKRGKALEYFSRHYGKVYVEEGREFTVKEALAGINEIIQDQSGSDAVKAPDKAEPLTRQFLRIFADKEQIERDQMQKFLRGSGVGPSDFITRGWCKEINRPKAFVWVDALEFAKEKKSLKNLRRDLDQAIFLVGASYSGSGINVKKEMNDSDFKPHPALGELFNWLGMHGPTSEFRNASYTARQLFNSWSAANQQVMMRQLSLFDLAEEE
jgi:adenine-specific DNA methylase